MSLTGDPVTDAMVPRAARLVGAVRERDVDAVRAVLDEVRQEAGRIGVDALVVVLAAMVPDDQSPSALLGWLRNPAEYLRLRGVGVDAATASTLAHNQPPNQPIAA